MKKGSKHVDKIIQLLENDEGARDAFNSLIFGNGRKPKKKRWAKKDEKQKISECKAYMKKVCSWDGTEYTPEMLAKAYNISVRKLLSHLD